MLVLSELFGELIIFILEKITDKVVDFSLSQRKVACAEFLKLHETLQEFRKFSHLLANEIDDLGDKASKGTYIRPVWPFEFIAEANRLTKEFLEQYPSLSKILKIYDSQLVALLSTFQYEPGQGRSKMEFALFGTKFLFCDAYWLDYRNLVLKLPVVTDIDFEELEFEYGKAIFPKSFFSLTPKPSLGSLRNLSVFQSSSLIQDINSKDFHTLKELSTQIREHEARTDLAVESLAQFIRYQFTLDDLLTTSTTRGRVLTIPQAGRKPQWVSPLRPEVPPEYRGTSEREIIMRIIAAQLPIDIDQIDPSANFYELGANSLDVIELVMTFEDEFDVEITDEAAEGINTMEDVLSFLSDHKKGISPHQ